MIEVLSFVTSVFVVSKETVVKSGKGKSWTVTSLAIHVIFSFFPFIVICKSGNTTLLSWRLKLKKIQSFIISFINHPRYQCVY